MAIEIIQIREEHIEGYHAAVDAVARERAYLARLEAPPLEASREFVRANILRGCPHLVALEHGRVIGWCDVTPKTRPTEQHCGVLGMGLLAHRRRQGIGSDLIRRALELARDFGFARVELTVRADNERAQALYRKFGFAVEGVNRRATLIDGMFYDVVMMALLFDVAEPVSDAGASIEAGR